MKQAVKSALGLGATAATPLTGGINAPLTTGLSSYGPTLATIPVAQTVTVPTVVDSVETIQQPVLSQTTTTVQKQVIPAIVEHREVAPVVHQRIRQEEVEEIQPVIHREREKTEIHKILQPMYTTSTMGIAAEERTLAAQIRPEVRLQGAPPPAAIIPTTQYESAQKVRVDRAPIVMETERKKIIEEVQPVVYKEVIQPHVIHVTQPIYEKIVEADVYVERILPATTFVAPVVTPVVTASTTTVAAPISATSLNIAEPTTAFTQTYEINTPVSAPAITSNRIEGVSQGVQVAPLPVTVQPLQQQSLGIQQPLTPIQSLSSGSIQPLQQQSFLGNQSSMLSSQGGLAQPGFGQQQFMQPGYPQSNLGMQSNMMMPQSNLGMQPYGQQGFAQQGFQQGLGQPGFQQGFAQPGFQQGLAQPGFQQGLGQQGFQQGLGQQGLQQGLGQPGFGQQGLGQPGFTQGLTSGLGQQLGQQLGSSLGKGGLGNVGSTLGGALATAF
jgi:hypothetical protein